MQCGGLVDDPSRVPAIIEISCGVLHLVDRPFGDFQRQVQAFGIAVPEEYEGIDRLGTALDVYRQCLVVIVSRSSVRQEKSLLPDFISTRQIIFEGVVAGALHVMLETIQHIGCVKVVHPV